ncbi:LysR family transcriptional regulator [Vibrio sp. 99-8-1]|uniref:LysR family transcriptional regulator n=1 Tax=Vibrio sp. 99-8-1 TaxID=2607602 RepID=UPI0014933CE3|nr:LysR family transcriptional regulator [Vibrio sp. 99-8-1]NOI67565.1 LysR family transcriptional regulator [Vibrio sp. 99-8-1]
MLFSFEQLKSMVVFTHVVEQGSFSAAARQIELSRTVVSYHIKKLEDNLGVTLINRSTRSLSLTEAGKAYYESCRVIAEQAQSAQSKMENFKREPEGLIKITCPVNVGLQIIVPALNDFKEQFPKIELDVMLSDDVVNIIQDGFDLAIRGAPLPDSALQATKLSTLPTCLCGAPSYFSKHGRPTTPTELDNHQWVLYKLASNTIELTKGTRSFRVKPKGTISTNNAAARTAFVEGGHGISRIPTYDVNEKLKQGTLEAVMTDYQLPHINVFAVFPPRGSESKKLRVLIDYLKQYFVKRDSEQNLNF